jgi:uncharacterized membrane protein YraQ (UPF0718 family)
MNDKKPLGRWNWRSMVVQYGLSLLFLVFIAWSHTFGFVPGQAIGRSFTLFVLEMAAFLPFMFVLVGLFDIWVPKEKVMRHVGKGSGILGTMWVILLVMLQAGPLSGAFPVAAMLWKKGCTPFNVFVYLGAFSALKIPMLTFEVGFLGWKFSLLRTLFSLPVFILIAAVIDRSFRAAPFVMKQPEQSNYKATI